MVNNTHISIRKRFLWWLATAEEELLADCVVDRNRYAIIGMLVLGTWTFATLAWTYFFSTVVDSFLIAIMLGLFMGWLILQIDRALIKGITGARKQKFLPLIFRGMLALSIGLFMAQPALLFLFDKEVKVQASIDNEQRKRTKQREQEAVYANEKAALLNTKKSATAALNNKYAAVAAARKTFIQETDGTGGSKKIGLKNIALVKKAAYEKTDFDYQQTVSELTPQIKYADSSLKLIDAAIKQEQQAFQGLLNNGFITRIEALNHLVKNNNSVAFRYYLLVAILLLIELMPVLAKLLLPAGTYEEKLKLREELEIKITQQNHKRELELKEMYEQSSFEQEKLFIKDFLDSAAIIRKAKADKIIQEWTLNPQQPYNTVLAEMKKDLLVATID